MSTAPRRTGLFVSLRQLLSSFVETVQVRLELLATEFQQEKSRLFDALLWALVALMLLGVGVVLLCGFVVLLFWEGYRLTAVGVLTALFLGGAALAVNVARDKLRGPGQAFAATVAELARDRDKLAPRK
jgi:uncharacterized membrane protein YqjE